MKTEKKGMNIAKTVVILNEKLQKAYVSQNTARMRSARWKKNGKNPKKS